MKGLGASLEVEGKTRSSTKTEKSALDAEREKEDHTTRS